MSFDIKFIRLHQKHVGLVRLALPLLHVRCFWYRLMNVISKDTNMVCSICAQEASPFLCCFWSRLINLIPKDTNMVFSITARQASPFLSCFWSRLINFISKTLTRYSLLLLGKPRDSYAVLVPPNKFDIKIY